MYVTLLSSTCFGPWNAHPQEEKLHKHSIWYPSSHKRLYTTPVESTCTVEKTSRRPKIFHHAPTCSSGAHNISTVHLLPRTLMCGVVPPLIDTCAWVQIKYKEKFVHTGYHLRETKAKTNYCIFSTCTETKRDTQRRVNTTSYVTVKSRNLNLRHCAQCCF